MSIARECTPQNFVGSCFLTINPPLIPGPMYEKAGIETKTVSNKNNLFITVHFTTYKIIDNIDIFFCMHNSRPTQSINITISIA